MLKKGNERSGLALCPHRHEADQCFLIDQLHLPSPTVGGQAGLEFDLNEGHPNSDNPIRSIQGPTSLSHISLEFAIISDVCLTMNNFYEIWCHLENTGINEDSLN